MRELAGRDAEFSISHDPGEGTPAGQERDWLELLANGLTFDLSGLAPGAAQPAGRFAHRFGLPDSFVPERCAALALEPGPHLAGGEGLLPVVRSQAWLATRLCALPGVAAVGWSPARSVSSVEQFVGGVRRWLEGGAFPALGLTALVEAPDRGLHSSGLAFFTGQELRLEPELTADKAAAARLALRLINELVGREPISRVEQFAGPDGEALLIEPSENGRFARVRPAAE